MAVMTVLDKALLGAAFAQIALTLGLLIRMGLLRVKAVQKRKVSLSAIALSSDKYPGAARKAGNAFANQFELPVLFYFAIALALIAGPAGWVEVTLAWAFVALRFVHAAIHTTKNDVMNRFHVYFAGVIVLTAFLAVVFTRLFLTGSP